MPNKINIYFLGTSGGVPTKSRNLTSIIINYSGKNYLFDAPENVQQQIMKLNLSIMKIENIFITHLHGDHYFGILGLLATMQLNNRENDLNIYLPVGSKKDFINFIKSSKLNLNFKVNFIGVKSNFNYKNKNILINSLKLKHSIQTYGYIFKIKDKIGKFNKKKAIKLGIPEGKLYSKLQNGKSIRINGKIIRPEDVIDFNFKKIGKKIAYILDTEVLKKTPEKLKNVDILIHESTFFKDNKDKAVISKHSVGSDVAKFAKKISAKKLYLLHISPRYKDLSKYKREVKKLFKNTEICEDLSKITLQDY